MATSTPNEPAEAREEVEAVGFYWRPGCGFCARLERALGTANVPIVKHDIWTKPDAAAFVRSVANGNETVPTVTVGETALVNPEPAELLKLLEIQVPHLLDPQ